MEDNEQQYLNARQVARRYSVSTPTVWRWLSEGLLPEPHRFTPSCSRWSLATLREFEAALDEQRVPRAAWNTEHKRKRQARRKRKR